MKMGEKLDRIIEVQGHQAETLARLTVSVEDHVRRTTLLEESIKPVQKHISMVEGAMKFVGLLALIATIIEAIHLAFK